MRQTLATSFAVALALPLLAQQQPAPPQPRPPIFRAGAHYVRVDAYPTDKKGNIVEGLTRDDFEIYEDGKLQEIESANFITFDRWTPDGERKDPRTQQDAYDLAADPNWRVFVIVIDPDAYTMEARHYLRAPLHDFIERNLGPRDLFGLLTTRNEWTDLVLGQTTTAANAAIDSREWPDPERIDDRDWPYYECGMGSLIGIKRLDDTYLLFEGLVKMLGLVRQERKGIIFVSNGLSVPARSNGSGSSNPFPPSIPKIGIEGGRIGGIGGMGPRDRVGTRSMASFCNAERMRLTNIDFRERHRELLEAARQGNVAFYPVSPLGLQTLPFKERGGVDMGRYHANVRRADSLITLANETDGIAIVNTNDLSGGLRRIANDMQAYYVLGYYTTNTKWDGGVRSIKVRLKPKRNTVRARKEYRAPTEGEIAAFSRPSAPRVPTPEENAVAALTPVRSYLPFTSYAAREAGALSIVLELPKAATAWPASTEILVMAESADGTPAPSTRTTLKSTTRTVVMRLPLEAGYAASTAYVRVRTEGMVFTDLVPLPPASTIVGDAMLLRNGTPAALRSFSRSDVIRVEWAILRPLDASAVRLLDRRGQPLPIRLDVDEDARADRHAVAAELALAPLARGEYIVEIIASASAVSERKLVAFRVE
jgi:VWFA-related protein